jgi:F-type H+-transporting ATPase subunit delta
MSSLRVARRYAHAVMLAAEQTKSLASIATDLEKVAALIEASREFRMLLASPIVSPAKKAAVIREIFAKRIGTDTLNVMLLMIEKHRESVLREMIVQFQALRDEQLGIINVDVTTAVEITGPQEKDLVKQLEKTTKKKVRVRFALDHAIAGGLVIRIGDTVLDASVRRQLELLRQRFVAGGPLAN